MIVLLSIDDDGSYPSKWRAVKESHFGLMSTVWREMIHAGDITEVSPTHHSLGFQHSLSSSMSGMSPRVYDSASVSHKTFGSV